MKRSLRMTALCLCTCLSSAVAAQGYPAKPLRIVNPFAAGGNTDIITRAIIERLAPVLKQQIIMENRPGAMTNIASEYVAKAPPDGYTLLMGGASNAINMSYLAKVPYDTLRDLEPVILCLKGANVLAVHPSLPVRNVKELIALARAQPAKLNYASSGLGSSNHMAGELLKVMAKIDIQHVPYKGNNPALTDAMGGHVHMLFAGVPSLLPPVKSGRLRAIAISVLTRAPALPDVATFDESGVKGYEATNWFGLFTAAKTPRDIVARLNGDIDKVIHSPDLVERFGNESLEVIGGPPESFRAFVRAEIDKYAKVIAAAGIAKQ
ncbi:MAG TPA: tripartite tricarboxylate transporter substrate binding protein [Burkholderiales bacterium]|nr:tripartite tricarboxylate transporter substrate binding protein [Burkholderiales bacterium]